MPDTLDTKDLIPEDAASTAEGAQAVQDAMSNLQDFEVQLAGLESQAADQAVETIGNMDVLDAEPEDFQHAIDDAREAFDSAKEAAQLGEEQTKAIQDGDLDRAQELNTNAQYELKDATEHGNDSAPQLVEAEHEGADIGNAQWDAEIADDNTEAGLDYLEDGDFDHAEQYLDDAADHASTSSDYASQGEHDSSSSSYDASTDSD